MSATKTRQSNFAVTETASIVIINAKYTRQIEHMVNG